MAKGSRGDGRSEEEGTGRATRRPPARGVIPDPQPSQEPLESFGFRPQKAPALWFSGGMSLRANLDLI